MSAETIPNRTDKVLHLIAVTDLNELTTGHMIDTLKTDDEFQSFTVRAILESMAHLESNGRIAFTPKVEVTKLGYNRLACVGLLDQPAITDQMS